MTNPPSGAGDVGSGREQLLITAATAVAQSSELESLSRPFLNLLHELTDLESFYVTEVALTVGEQRVLYADTRTDLPSPEGYAVDWEDTLCKRALESGTRSTSNVAADLPGSYGATQFGLVTFTSVPIVSTEDELLGTLCGMSRKQVEVPQRVVDVMTMLAGLIGEAWERERRLTPAAQRAEAAESQLRERAAFLAEAEFQVKPALVQVKGWSDLLSSRWESMTTERRDATLAAIRSSSGEALRQLEDLLEESQTEALAEEIRPRPLSVREVIKEVISQLQSTTTRHVITGPGAESADTEHAEELLVLADRRALWQILWHIGENAVQYSPDGGTISVDLEPSAERVQIVVADEGIGLPTDVDVFAPYVRGSELGSQRVGLGLHLARNLARSLGGTVTAEPRQPRGSVFRVDLPRLDEAARD